MLKPGLYSLYLEVCCFTPRRYSCVRSERIECNQIGQIRCASSRHIGKIPQLDTNTIAGFIHLSGDIHIIDYTIEHKTEGRPRPELDIQGTGCDICECVCTALLACRSHIGELVGDVHPI